MLQLLGRDVAACPQRIAFSLLALYLCSELLNIVLNNLALSGILLAQRSQARVGFEGGYAAVDLRNLGFANGKLAVRVEQIVDSWHKIGQRGAVSQIARKRCQKPDCARRVLHHHHAQHLALVEFGQQLGAGGKVALHLLGSLDAQRMRSVAKRVGEARRQLVGCHVAIEMM